MDALESEFLEYHCAWMISPCAVTTFGTKYLNKLIYILVNLFLNTMQNLLNYYFWFLTVIHFGREYLVQPERSAKSERFDGCYD